MQLSSSIFKVNLFNFPNSNHAMQLKVPLKFRHTVGTLTLNHMLFIGVQMRNIGSIHRPVNVYESNDSNQELWSKVKP